MNFYRGLINGFIISIIIWAVLICAIVFADEFRIPFSVYPKDLQERFAQAGRKLDLSDAERTEDSWGFLENKGTNFVIYTYHPVTDEELSLIMEILWQPYLKQTE